MPDVMNDPEFTHLQRAETTSLLLRLEELKALPDRNDDALKELVIILRLLRGRASTSRSGGARTPAEKRVIPTADML